jgi:hypothetical protein
MDDQVVPRERPRGLRGAASRESERNAQLDGHVHGQAGEPDRRPAGQRRPRGDRLLHSRLLIRPQALDARLASRPYGAAATDGAYSVKGLPPGEYFLAAPTDLETGEWNDPVLLEQLVLSSAFRTPSIVPSRSIHCMYDAPHPPGKPQLRFRYRQPS